MVDLSPLAVKLAVVDSPSDIEKNFDEMVGLFENPNVSHRIYELLEEAARDKAKGKGHLFHTVQCQLHQLCQEQRSDIVLWYSSTPDYMAKAQFQHVARNTTPLETARVSACVVTMAVKRPAGTGAIRFGLVMIVPDNGATAARIRQESSVTGSDTARTSLEGPPPDPTACVHCGAAAAKKKCSRCLSARYCGAACQRASWPEHKKVCRPAPQPLPAEMSTAGSMLPPDTESEQTDVGDISQEVLEEMAMLYIEGLARRLPARRAGPVDRGLSTPSPGEPPSESAPSAAPPGPAGPS